jgi:6-phosphogluconolactonase
MLRPVGIANLDIRHPAVLAGLLGLTALACGGGGSPTDGGSAGSGGSAAGGRGGSAAGGRGGTGGASSPTGGTGGTAGVAGASGGAGGGGTGGGAGAGGGAPDGAPAEAGAPADGPSGSEGGSDAPPVPAGNPFVYVGSNLTSEIRIFQLDLQTGALMARGRAEAGDNPDYLAFHPGGKFLYALNEINPGRVVAFSIDARTGALTELNRQPSGGDGPAHISIHKTGRWLLAANYDSGHAAALPILADGRLGPPVRPVLAGANAHMIVDDGATGRFVFVPSKGDNRVLQYRFDDATGVLTPNSPAFVAQAGAPRHLAFHRDGQWAYLLTEAGRSVVSYRYDSTAGLLTDGVPRLASNDPRSDGAHIMVHPFKDIVYASIRSLGAGNDGSMAIFPIGADGRVGAPAQVITQIARPWDFAIDPTGRFLIVANNDAANVRVFRIDQQTGGLTIVGTGATVSGRPRFVGILAPPGG